MTFFRGTLLEIIVPQHAENLSCLLEWAILSKNVVPQQVLFCTMFSFSLSFPEGKLNLRWILEQVWHFLGHSLQLIMWLLKV